MKRKLKCIMLIDDDEPTNFLSTMFIEEAGCSEYIQVTESAQQALTYLTASERPNGRAIYPYPDLIFLDINMPAMNGWEFIEKYKDLRKNEPRKTVIIMLSTSLDPDDVLKANRIAEVSGFEHKPLTTEKVERIVKKYFENYFQ